MDSVTHQHRRAGFVKIYPLHTRCREGGPLSHLQAAVRLCVSAVLISGASLTPGGGHPCQPSRLLEMVKDLPAGKCSLPMQTDPLLYSDRSRVRYPCTPEPLLRLLG